MIMLLCMSENIVFSHIHRNIADSDCIFFMQTEFNMFVKDESAAEIGSSKASMNRCGKANAAKGVHNHYNEYKDFHAREVEAHICSSFMEMHGMSTMDGEFEINNLKLVDWQIELCHTPAKKHTS